MLKISADQIALQGKMSFIERLDESFCRQYPDFATLPDEERIDFLVESLLAAERAGLCTEQGIASYALASYWLELGFESKSKHLKALLSSSLPEIRKVHAMNAWVHTILGAPDQVELADESMKQAFQKTAAWGR